VIVLAKSGTHIPVGLISPWIIIMGFALLRNRISSAFYDYPWFVVALFVTVASFVGERTPDTIEPPKDPHHRGVFHWLIGSFALLYIIFFLLAFPYLPWLPLTYDKLLGLLIVSYLIGYASHFILDYLVPS
jgi:hypothetical protein